MASVTINPGVLDSKTSDWLPYGRYMNLATIRRIALEVSRMVTNKNAWIAHFRSNPSVPFDADTLRNVAENAKESRKSHYSPSRAKQSIHPSYRLSMQSTEKSFPASMFHGVSQLLMNRSFKKSKKRKQALLVHNQNSWLLNKSLAIIGYMMSTWFVRRIATDKGYLKTN